LEANQSRDHHCQYCGKSYLSAPALYLHVKSKHIPSSSVQVHPDGKRGRGRPRRNGVYDIHGSGRIDPTTEMFMRTEEKMGGPTDPMYSFEEGVALLFGSRGKYSDYTQHPMFPYLHQFSFKITPPGNMDDIGIKKTFRDVTKEINNTSETTKNNMNCE